MDSRPDKRTWALIVGALAAAGALAWAFAPRPVDVETAVAERARFEESIEEDGRTRLPDRYTISAPVAARVARITLREGDAVRAGDPVAVLTPLMPSMVDERSLREASARLKAAQASVTAAGARMERARVAREEAQLDLQRTERLAREGFVSASRLDSARLALTGATRELEAAQAGREVAMQERAQAAAVLEPTTPSTVRSTTVRPTTVRPTTVRPTTVRPEPVEGQAPASTSLARTDGKTDGTLVLRAPVAGVVLKVPARSESTIAPGAALLDIGDPRRLEVVAELLTTDAVRAQPGTPAMVERWGGPPVPARVRRVEPAAYTKVSALGIEEQRVNVLLDVAETPPAWDTLGDGFRVTVRVITQGVDGATVVPVGALFPLADGGMAVFRIAGGRARLQPVDLGGRNGQVGWIKSGLKPGDAVIVYPPPAVADGKRVRLRKP